MNRYSCTFSQNRRCWELVNYDGLRLFEEAPPDRIIRLDDDAVLAVVQAAKNSDWLNGLVQSRFDVEVTRAHLSLLDKLTDIVAKHE